MFPACQQLDVGSTDIDHKHLDGFHFAERRRTKETLGFRDWQEKGCGSDEWVSTEACPSFPSGHRGPGSSRGSNVWNAGMRLRWNFAVAPGIDLPGLCRNSSTRRAVVRGTWSRDHWRGLIAQQPLPSCRSSDYSRYRLGWLGEGISGRVGPRLPALRALAACFRRA